MEEWRGAALVRLKSEAVREAILASAAKEISANGYLDTTIGRIAKGAGIAPSNVYVYFESKLQIYFTIYEPWFKTQFAVLERTVSKQSTRQKKINALVQGILRDIADDKTGYTAALMEALAAVKPKDKYRPDLLAWAEERIEDIVVQSIGGYHHGHPDLKAFAHLMMLTFDGSALRAKILRANAQEDKTMEAVEAMLKQIIMVPQDEPAGRENSAAV
ncbi:MAG TPA: TetR/AcrR family transcriptional regulator [Shinella sp.]|uniref:TetR/AcrR family transcriptional regulator n=1 Tax=Shinella sp. TaxID=1870904 RepID=UPI0029BC7AF5|nr:TetR/AcrR family transcriptional regulator [Shinella sp.]MDX3974794.1 TetR/AcrR family transcriptional regulator [Shinella sp.]HEV7247804.1 TetR/AcrR family transcriptional regulator [Shinella sp.]